MATKTKKSKDPRQIPVFRGEKKQHYQRLLDLRDHLVDQIQTISAHSLSSSKQAGEELADIGSDNFIREMGLSLMSEEGQKVHAIQDAIERLKDNTYGTCQECEGKIQLARLEAIPYAKLCITCKSQVEKQQGFD